MHRDEEDDVARAIDAEDGAAEGSTADPAEARPDRPAAREDLPVQLAEHLRAWVGAWPPREPFDVVGTERREQPGWDGSVQRLLAVQGPGIGTVLAVPPALAGAVREEAERLDLSALAAAALTSDSASEEQERYTEAGRRLRQLLPELFGSPHSIVGFAPFRWSTRPADLPDAGEWLPVDDPRVPEWLHPFRGPALVHLDDDGRWLAGVGVKRHDRHGHELAVVTEERARGGGLARRLVAQAARAVLAEGAVPTYLHAPDNLPSARVADAVGFPDRGWRLWALFERR